MLRTGAPPEGEKWRGWTPEAIDREEKHGRRGRHGMRCWSYLHEAASPIANDPQMKLLTRLVGKFGKHRCTTLLQRCGRAATRRRRCEGAHRDPRQDQGARSVAPVAIIQAPVGSVEELRAYRGASDVIGFDIYPVAEKYGLQSDRPNKTISVVGDLTQDRTRLGAKSTWMTLQITCRA